MKKTWLGRFSLAARWYLPRDEAEAVIADCADLLDGDGRSGKELERDLGLPRQAAAMLAQEKDYRRWLIAFCAMAAAALLPGLYSLPIVVGFVGSLWYGPVWWVLFLAGIAAALVWFRPKGEGRKPLPGGAIPLLAAELVFAALAWAFGLSLLFRLEWMVEIFQTHPALASALRLGVWWAPLPMAALALYALARARLENRRWRSVYLLGLTAAVLWVLVGTTMHSMELDYSSWLINRFLRRWLIVTLVGLTGTGVGLC